MQLAIIQKPQTGAVQQQQTSGVPQTVRVQDVFAVPRDVRGRVEKPSGVPQRTSQPQSRVQQHGRDESAGSAPGIAPVEQPTGSVQESRDVGTVAVVRQSNSHSKGLKHARGGVDGQK
jgi:hypothetical protein